MSISREDILGVAITQKDETRECRFAILENAETIKYPKDGHAIKLLIGLFKRGGF